MSAAASSAGPPPGAAGRDEDVLETILAPLRQTASWWWILLVACGAGLVLMAVASAETVGVGIGTWGNNIPVAWAFGIVNFVWWIGIGHAGTFISAFLLLLNQPWRSAIARMAEAMTLIALVNAAAFPVLHMGRPWFLYWLLPYPATMGVWPNFKSALTWDIAAIATYFVVSAIFFFLGLVPDLATARDALRGRGRRRAYGVLALGWIGSGRQWRRRRAALGLLAALAAALVVSVHSIVSLDFSTAQLSGWHSTMFPPYFVLGALYSGLAMVLALAIPVRAAYGLEQVITPHHLDRLAKLLLSLGLVLAYCYVVELFTAWYGGGANDRATHLVHWPRGPYARLYWTMLALNLATPQLLWSARARRDPRVLLPAAVSVLVGMWLERFVIVVASLSRGALPSSWRDYAPTWVDLSLLAGSFGVFGLLFLLFLRFVPMAALSELRRQRFEAEAST